MTLEGDGIVTFGKRVEKSWKNIIRSKKEKEEK
jgi:hypothetical protein